MDTLTKRDIIDEIAAEVNLDHRAATEVVEAFLELIKETLEKGEDVNLSGFGKWQVKEKRARRGRNPQTGEELTISPRRVVTFSLSNVLRAKLVGQKKE
jgi:integration host factor subunit alpha